MSTTYRFPLTLQNYLTLQIPIQSRKDNYTINSLTVFSVTNMERKIIIQKIRIDQLRIILALTNKIINFPVLSLWFSSLWFSSSVVYGSANELAPVFH